MPDGDERETGPSRQDWPPRTSPARDRGPTIRWTRLIRATARRARDWADALTGPVPVGEHSTAAMLATPLGRLTRVVLTDEVSRTLFGEYAAHRASERGAEETGWVLLGRREPDAAVVLATLPAGAARDAGEAHIRFNGEAQAVGSQIVRQADRRLGILGVVHTHPGRLRHPSRGDFDGDRLWVRNLRGGQGVFGIGTLFPHCPPNGTEVARHPKPHVQTFGGLRFDWYTLAESDKRYRPVPIEVAIGPDLALPLRGIWGAVEEHAARLLRLIGQFKDVRFEVGQGTTGPALRMTIGLGEPGRVVRVLIDGKTVRYAYEAGGVVTHPDLPADTAPDQGVYLLLAETAARE